MARKEPHSENEGELFATNHGIISIVVGVVKQGVEE